MLIILYNKACAVAASYTFFEAQTFRFESRSNRIRCILAAEGEPFVKEQNKPRVGKVKILHASIWQAISSNIAIHLKTMFLDVNKVDRNIILKKVPLKLVTMKNMLGTF